MAPSSSPQWDNRNRGFISPAELQQLRQASPGRIDLHDFPSRQQPAAQFQEDQQQRSQQPQPQLHHEPQQSPLSAPQPRPPMPAPAQSHARASSFFSFRNKPAQNDAQDGPATSPPSSFHGRKPSVPQSTDFGPAPTPMDLSKSLGPAPRSPDPQQPPTSQRRMSTGNQPGPPPLHPEIRSVVQLTLAHARKVYFSGPLVRRIERQPDGQRPTKDDGWTEVWAQLGGTTLSIWDMAEIEEANKQGREVPPAYVNMTDAFVQVLGSVTVPATPDKPAQKYANVLTLNTAGSNLLLFSCPNTTSLVSWATALRLSAWEKSRLEEIYTAHLIRITLPEGKDTRSTLVRGRMEGWVRIRVAGQTDWKRMWMVASSGSNAALDMTSSNSTDSTRPGSPNAPRKKRMSNLFSREHSPDRLPPRPILSLFSSPKPKDKKKALLTLRDVSQAFAVYPERPELINRSTLMKLEGLIGDEETAGGMRGREGWLLVMPELEAGNTQASEMLKWLVALHDAFELYGRPKAYTWDPRDPNSMMFAYPVGPGRDLLFLDREVAETMDPRDDRTSAVRSRLLNVLHERMHGPDSRGQPTAPGVPALPPLNLNNSPQPPQQQPQQYNIQSTIGNGNGNGNGQLPQLPELPSLDFDSSAQQQDSAGARALSPITEHSTTRETLADFALTQSRSMSSEYPTSAERSRSMSDDQLVLSNRPSMRGAASVLAEGMESGLVTGLPLTTSPPPVQEPKNGRKLSGDSFGKTASSRPDSKLTPSIETTQTKSTETNASSPGVDVMGVKLPFSPISPESPNFSDDSLATTPPLSPKSRGRRAKSPPPGSPERPLASPARSPPPESPAFSVMTSPYSPAAEKELPSIHAAQNGGQFVAPRPEVSPSVPPKPSRSSFRGASASPVPPPATPAKPVSPKPMSPPPTVQATAPPAKQPPPPQDQQNVFSDALFYMQQLGGRPEGQSGAQRVPPTITENDDADRSTSSSSENNNAGPSYQTRAPPTAYASSSQSRRARSQQPTMAESGVPTTLGISQEASLAGSRPSLGRKPSGARAPHGSSRPPNLEPSSVSSPGQHLHRRDNDTTSMSDAEQTNTSKPAGPSEDENADALAALSFLDNEPAPPPAGSRSPLPRQAGSPQPGDVPSAPGSSESAGQYRSSFAPSKQAAQRKARAQAQQAAHQAAVHRPGRVNGKRVGSGRGAGGWNESSEEEEEEEEDEEDEDADSDDEPSAADNRRTGPSNQATVPPPAPAPAMRQPRPQSGNASPGEAATDGNPYAQLRHPRNLPPVPRPQTGGPDDYFSAPPPPRRFANEQRSRTPDEGGYPRPQTDFQQHAATRQSIWTQVLDPGRSAGANPQPDAGGHQRDTFVQLEPASHSMTKAFTAHGLLSAGLQDKSDRSAKRQEELARETGASLINVPNKPPPPQTGLLGAITAHERERKREGGVGAALTEREREKRMAEERQRKLDDFQRQQLEMAQTGGHASMYGGQFPGFNPMMGNPMMMGMNPMMTGANPMMAGANPMNPMMTGGYMGYPGMMPGYGNPQYMFAAQQAAQAAYQQAMMAFSTAGSHVGGDGMHGGQQPMNPMMTGGGMGGYDPRMSMMGMPMMGAPMPMGQMGMGMNGMNGMGMQMTGGSGFDPRFSPGDEALRPPGALGGQGQGRASSRPSSAGQGSPAGPRPVDAPARDSPKH
ncbi:hypothetical protein BV22DRAFT_1043400 [Leucogyrophana mollusca]|uniref:Uncharacterized protein n=1 Tax=Leucogyrophana mollusca TaxID=85980 RepID=A0ACB8BY77_9AGAM|nr:hypothetical protein BV22DRAFT_1043400 [Leucogyrophana mollusca]